jgi:hypothetical protein
MLARDVRSKGAIQMADDKTTTDNSGDGTGADPATDAAKATGTETGTDDGKGGKDAVLADLKKTRDRAKAAEAKLQALELEKLPELDRYKTRADAAERKVQELEQQVMRLNVATKLKLPAEVADRVRGDSEAEMIADAKALLSVFAGGKVDEDDTGKTKNDAKRTGSGVKPTMNQLLRSAAGYSD